jgi:hypothetical protein
MCANKTLFTKAGEGQMWPLGHSLPLLVYITKFKSEDSRVKLPTSVFPSVNYVCE